MFGLLHEDVGRVVGIHVGLLGKFTTPDIVVQTAALNERVHVVLVLSDSDYQLVEVFYESVTATFHEPQLEVAMSR